MNERFKKLTDEYGFSIKDTFALINGIWTKRPDIQSVTFKGHHLMTIPRKMYGEPKSNYKTLEGTEQPMYFDREYRLKNWNIIVKRSPHIQRLEQDNIDIHNLENKLYKHAKA